MPMGRVSPDASGAAELRTGAVSFFISLFPNSKGVFSASARAAPTMDWEASGASFALIGDWNDTGFETGCCALTDELRASNAVQSLTELSLAATGELSLALNPLLRDSRSLALFLMVLL